MRDLGVSDGHFTNWAKMKDAKTTGYVIEDIVSHSVKGVQGIELQFQSGNARPDFKIVDGSLRGVVDITSSGEAGHILHKDFNINSFDYAAECIYPSIDFGNYANSKLTFSKEDEALIAQARHRRAREQLGSRIQKLKGILDLMVHDSNATVGQCAGKAREALSHIKSDFWTVAKIVDKNIAEANALLHNVQLDTIGDIVASVKEKYGVKEIFDGI